MARTTAIQHLIAIFLAFILTSVLYVVVRCSHMTTAGIGTYIPNLDYAHNGHGKEALENFVRLGDSLSGGETIVVFGSSELTTTDSKYIPYNFFPNTLHTPVLAYGHAYFQSMGIYGLLSALQEDLNPKSRVVIMLSPGWFGEGEMLPQAISEHFNDEVLLRLYRDEKARRIFSEYFKRNEASFSHLTSVQKAFYQAIPDSDTEETLHKLELENELYLFKLKSSLLIGSIVGNLKTANHSMDSINLGSNTRRSWAGYKQDAQYVELSNMKNNKYYVRDDYFDKYLKKLTPSGMPYFQTPVQSSELDAIQNVMILLRAHGIHGIFIMQPLNPYVYNDIDKIHQINDQLKKLSSEYQMIYFDMYSDSTKSRYVPGTLRDAMHLGELGWADVDEVIANSFGISL